MIPSAGWSKLRDNGLNKSHNTLTGNSNYSLSYDCYQLFFTSYKCNILSEYLQFPSYLMPIRFSVFLAQCAVWLTHLFFIPFGLESSKLLIILYLVHSMLCIGNVFVFLPCISSTVRNFAIDFRLMYIFPCMIIIV